jgi:hypothetical protein
MCNLQPDESADMLGVLDWFGSVVGLEANLSMYVRYSVKTGAVVPQPTKYSGAGLVILFQPRSGGWGQKRKRKKRLCPVLAFAHKTAKD